MRFRAFALVSVASLAMLAGCGDDGGDNSTEAQTFCTVVDPIQALTTVLENYEDVDGVKTTMTGAESALDKVTGTPPAGIAEDITVVNAAFAPANEALKTVDYDYNALSDAEAEAVAALTEPEFITASDNIQTWSSDNC